MAKRKTRAQAGSGDDPQVTAQVEDEVAAGVATAAGTGATTGAAAASAADQLMQVVSDSLNQLRQQLNNVTESITKVVEQKVDVGEQESQGAGIAQGSDTHRNIQAYMAWNSASASDRMGRDMAHYGGIAQAMTTVHLGSVQTLNALILATAANDETQQRSQNWRARCAAPDTVSKAGTS